MLDVPPPTPKYQKYAVNLVEILVLFVSIPSSKATEKLQSVEKVTVRAISLPLSSLFVTSQLDDVIFFSL
jgi:hypothetical protein